MAFKNRCILHYFMQAFLFSKEPLDQFNAVDKLYWFECVDFGIFGHCSGAQTVALKQ